MVEITLRIATCKSSDIRDFPMRSVPGLMFVIVDSPQAKLETCIVDECVAYRGHREYLVPRNAVRGCLF